MNDSSATQAPLLCQHCHTARAWRARRRWGLCRASFRVVAIRRLYLRPNKYAPRGHPDYYGRGALPSPTTALPGTEAKVAVLEARAQRGEQLWHPRDAELPRSALA